jgi:hypothetical protein
LQLLPHLSLRRSDPEFPNPEFPTPSSHGCLAPLRFVCAWCDFLYLFTRKTMRSTTRANFRIEVQSNEVPGSCLRPQLKEGAGDGILLKTDSMTFTLISCPGMVLPSSQPLNRSVPEPRQNPSYNNASVNDQYDRIRSTYLAS